MKKYVEKAVLDKKHQELQNLRNNRRNRRINFSLMCLLIIVGGFFLSPWSQVTDVYIEGNYYYSREELLELLGIPNDNNILLVLSRLSEINKLPLVEKSRFSWVFPRKFYLHVNELPVYGYGISSDGMFLLSKEHIYPTTNTRIQRLEIKLPFINVDNELLIRKIGKHLANVRQEFLTLISEIKIFPRGHHPQMLEVMMNDGNRLFMKIEQLPLLKKYPSIVEKLQGEQRCIYFNELTHTAVASDCTEEKEN